MVTIHSQVETNIVYALSKFFKLYLDLDVCSVATLAAILLNRKYHVYLWAV